MRYGSEDRLFRREQFLRVGALIECGRDHFTNGATAFATVKLAAMMGLHGLWAARASVNRFADPSLINTAADANDHANDLQHVRMIVKNDSQQRTIRGARFGWRIALRLGKVPT